MIRNFDYAFPKPPGRVKIAGVLCVGALTLLALDAGLKLQTAPAAPPRGAASVHPAVKPSGVRNLSYYPEQLAALTSLASFQPLADAGVPDAPLVDHALKPPAPVLTPGEVKPLRRTESAAKPSPTLTPAATNATAAVAAPQEPPQDKSFKLFGWTAPGAELVSSMSDNAARWSASVWSLGGKAAGFWR